MVAVVWHPDGRRRLSAHGTYREPDGAVRYLEDDDLSFTAQSVWASLDTGVECPMDWQVAADSLGLDLGLTPCLEQWNCRSRRGRRCSRHCLAVHKTVYKSASVFPASVHT